VESDPDQAIGSAKELLETVAKLVLNDFGEDPEEYDTLQQLTKQAMRCLNPALEDLPNASRGANAIRQVVSGLAQVVGWWSVHARRSPSTYWRPWTRENARQVVISASSPSHDN
jgi:hypothetical protein